MNMKIDTDRVKQKKFTSAITSSEQKYSQEYRVLAVLRYLYPEKFSTMVKRDSPDLQDDANGIGIEVVSAVKDSDMRATRAFSEVCQAENEIDEKSRKRIETSGYSIIPILGDRNFICTTGTAEGEKTVFQKAIRKKLKNIDRYKVNFKQIGLAVVLPEIPTSYTEAHFSAWLFEVIYENEVSFDFVYILSYRFSILIDVKNKGFTKREISSEVSLALSKIARMTAEGDLSLTDQEWL